MERFFIIHPPENVLCVVYGLKKLFKIVSKRMLNKVPKKVLKIFLKFYSRIWGGCMLPYKAWGFDLHTTNPIKFYIEYKRIFFKYMGGEGR